MKTFARWMLGLGILWAGLAGCSEDEPKPGMVAKREPPVVGARPEPGTYDELVLEIEISSEEPGLTYFFGIDEEPNLDDGHPEKLRIRLNRSASVLVSVNDADGNLWGPYSFAYTLRSSVAAGSCSIAAERYYYRPVETVNVDIDYAFATGTSLLYFSVDGREELVGGPQTLEPTGTLQVPVGKIAGEGAHAVSCILRSGETSDEHAAEVFIDGTPPTGSWLSAGGAFSRANWPGEFRLQASDGGSGVERVALCKSGFTPCLDLEQAAADVYAYATVLTGDTSFQATLTPVIYDRAGNQTTLPQLAIDTLGFGEPPIAAPLAITLVTGAAIDLNAVLLSEGRAVAIAEAKSLDLSTSYDPAALPLTAGWNDFLYRQTGRNEWESFGVYRAGISVAYPASASPWLVFSSQSTAPGLQGTLIDFVPAGAGGTWAKAWFDVPHVWFVADHNANQRWDDADALWTTTGDAFSGAYQARLAPVATSLSEKASATPVTSAAKTVVCGVCAATGELYFEWRQEPYAYPESHNAFPLVSFSPVTDAVVSAWNDPAGWCGFFWDENEDGAVNGHEPRSFGACGESTFVLAKQTALGAAFADGRVALSGLPYGGMATGELLVSAGATALYHEAVLGFGDVNGTGAVTAAVPTPMNLPYSLRISNGTESVSVSLPVASPAESVWLGVEDENGAPVSAVGVVQRGAEAYGAVFDAAGGQVAVGLPPAQDGLAAQAFALRDGYVSVAAPVTGSAMAVRILSPAVTGRVIGTVRDRYDFPISNATLTWKAFSYSAKTLTDAQGWYSMPVSGYSGVVHVTAPGPYQRELYFPLTITQETRVQDFVLGDAGAPAWPLGANLGIWPEELIGAYVAPAYVGDTYYAARVTSGVFTVRSSYGTSRQVSLPGALPPLSADSLTRKSPPNELALTLIDHFARCGARLQLDLSFVGAVVDSPCWGWFARDAHHEYFLGMLTADGGFPAMRGLGVFNASVSGSGASLKLVDVLLGRVIQVPFGAGAVRVALPAGLYAVYSAAGAAGSPALVTVRAADNPVVSIVLP